jgi:hypothetical protein
MRRRVLLREVVSGMCAFILRRRRGRHRYHFNYTGVTHRQGQMRLKFALPGVTLSGKNDNIGSAPIKTRKDKNSGSKLSSGAPAKLKKSPGT